MENEEVKALEVTLQKLKEIIFSLQGENVDLQISRILLNGEIALNLNPEVNKKWLASDAEIIVNPDFEMKL